MLACVSLVAVAMLLDVRREFADTVRALKEEQVALATADPAALCPLVEPGRKVSDERIWPLAEACYADPFLDGHNRMKVALELLGRIDAAHVRPPLQPVPARDRAALRAALEEAGIRG